MTMEYKPIPEGTNKVYLDMWGCGPECCGAYQAHSILGVICEISPKIGHFLVDRAGFWGIIGDTGLRNALCYGLVVEWQTRWS